MLRSTRRSNFWSIIGIFAIFFIGLQTVQPKVRIYVYWRVCRLFFAVLYECAETAKSNSNLYPRFLEWNENKNEEKKLKLNELNVLVLHYTCSPAISPPKIITLSLERTK